VVPRRRGEVCLFCHGYLPSRPTGFPQIVERTHNPTGACINCHDPHDPTPPEVPGACSACHNQIVRTKSVSHHAPLPCETCHTVPAEHRSDPRRTLAGKPSDRALCAGCHDNEAESSPEIPRIDSETHGGQYLCWQCHYPHFPEG
jgi:predicted CXXCH cytochrome family protein